MDYSLLFTCNMNSGAPAKEKGEEEEEEREGEGGWPTVEAWLGRRRSAGGSVGFGGGNDGRCRLLVKEEEKFPKKILRIGRMHENKKKIVL